MHNAIDKIFSKMVKFQSSKIYDKSIKEHSNVSESAKFGCV